MTNEPTVPEDHTTFEHPILGQEAICPHGLGRVTTFRDHYPEQWIEVQLPFNNSASRWDPANVTLVPIPGVNKGIDASQVRRVSELKAENARLDRVVANLESEADRLSAHATELREQRNEFKRKVEHLSKGRCLHCVGAVCDDCDGRPVPYPHGDPTMNQPTQIAEFEQLTPEERLRWFRRHAWVAFAAAQLPNMEPAYAAQEADFLLRHLELRLNSPLFDDPESNEID